MLATSRLELFTGKGGVGKSSVVAAAALAAAAAGRRPLIVELGHRATIATLFGHPGVGHEPTPVAPGVHALGIDFDQALIAYVAEHTRVRAVARRLVMGDALNRFFRAAPAVTEVVTLRRLERLEAERDGERPRWDPILVDLDATGHALMFLSLPDVFSDLARRGPLARRLRSFSELLTDAARTSLSLVTLPSELPAQETLELHSALRAPRDQNVPLGRLYINRVPRPPVSAATRDLFGPLAEAGLAAEVALAQRLERRRNGALTIARRLEQAVDLPCVRLPELEPFRLSALAACLREAGP